jgi:predicted HTH transcriptional regulator
MVDPEDNYPLLPVRFIPQWELPAWADEELSREMPTLRSRGEDQNLEYMLKYPDQAQDLGKEIAAFASSGGGCILLGVGNKGELIGLEQMDSAGERDALVRRIEGLTHGLIKPGVTPFIAFALELGKIILCITVPPSEGVVYYCKNTPYIRHLTESRPAEPEEVKRILSRSRNDE